MEQQTKIVKKKERTIRSETTKVFLVIFAILALVGFFSIFSAIRGAQTFSTIRAIQLTQFRAAEVMKQRALDVIGIFYLLATDQDQEILMEGLKRYEELVESFDISKKAVEDAIKVGELTPDNQKVLDLLAETSVVWEELQNHCRIMTFAMMAGQKKVSAAKFPAIDKGIKLFKKHLDEAEGIVIRQLDDEANKAQGLLQNTTRLGIVITILAVFITVGLIYYLMQFLSISLLPISNLMHNMRQAVFSIDKNLTVIAPVSGYSNTVFGEEIVGKKVTEIAYKEVDLKSEAYSKTKMALDVVFGADDLQYMLQEDGLMRQVKRTFAGQEKILKLTYTPLLEKDLVQNLMIVAEDVTEVEGLRAETLKKQGEMEIIRGVIGLETGELEAFLSGSQAQMIECRTLLPKLAQSKDARQLLFRIQHTLKGNSRMYKLNAISDVVHVAENAIVEINKSIDAGEALTDEHTQSILQGLDKIEDCLALHSKMARKLFGLKDMYSGRAEEQLHNSIFGIENLLGASDFNPGSPEFGKLKADLLKAANYFESATMAEIVEGLTSKGLQSAGQRAQARAKVSDEYIKILLQNASIRSLELDSQRWISLFHPFIAYTQAIEVKASSAELGKMINEIIVLADTENLGFVRSVLEYSLSSQNAGVQENAVRSIWGFMSGVCALDAATQLAEANAQIVIKGLAASGEKDADLEKISSAGFLTLALLRSLGRKSVSQASFWGLAMKYMKLGSKEEGIRAFVSSTDRRDKLDEVLEAIKDGTLDGWNLGLAKLDSNFPLQHLLASQPVGSQLRICVMRLLATYKGKEGSSPFDTEEQTVSIPLKCFTAIKVLAAGLTKEAKPEEKMAQLQHEIDHAFDFPIHNVCRKIEPMITELSKRMGKNIQFRIVGENVAVCRDTAYLLRDALVHIIRNALDHGIETPEERLGNGKTARALLEIRVRREGKFVHISVRDDGRGIDSEKLFKKAVTNGLISADRATKMTTEEKLQLVFLPNLSIKEEVTALSGRGVGMDVVKSVTEELGGGISVKSTMNMGSEFDMSISQI